MWFLKAIKKLLESEIDVNATNYEVKLGPKILPTSSAISTANIFDINKPELS